MKMVLLSMFVVTSAFASPTEKKPVEQRMKPEHVARLDAALTHRMLIIQQADEATKPYNDQIAALCKLYNLEPKELGKTWSFNTETGVIQRAEARPTARRPNPESTAITTPAPMMGAHRPEPTPDPNQNPSPRPDPHPTPRPEPGPHRPFSSSPPPSGASDAIKR